MSNRRAIALIALLTIALLTFAGCKDKEPVLIYVADDPVTQPFIRYAASLPEGEVRDYVILTEEEGTQLAMINLTIYNQSGSRVDLNIDESAAELKLRDGKKARLINPIERALQPLEESDPAYTVEGFLPIWGAVQLDDLHELQGYLVFEIPLNSRISSLQWKEFDKVEISYE